MTPNCTIASQRVQATIHHYHPGDLVQFLGLSNSRSKFKHWNLPLPPSTSHASRDPFPRLFLQHLAASFVRLPVAPRDACERGTSWNFPHCHPTWSEKHASFLLAHQKRWDTKGHKSRRNFWLFLGNGASFCALSGVIMLYPLV